MDETDDVSGALCLCVCVYMKKKVKGRQRNSCSFGYTYGTMIYLYLRNNGDNDLFRNSCSFGYTERYWSDTLTEQWYIYTYGTMIYLLPLGTLRGTGATRPLTCPGSRLKEQSALASSSVVVGDALEIWRAHGSHFYSPKLAFCHIHVHTLHMCMMMWHMCMMMWHMCTPPNSLHFAISMCIPFMPRYSSIKLLFAVIPCRVTFGQGLLYIIYKYYMIYIYTYICS